ncbi:MAG: molybdenum cofactor guanylyltransferase MobA [Thiotrichaceae bacterium]|nr:molybdenum cofactor guanylyltransferase MobA [Thiotrichaceae bacterium]
MNAIDEMTPDNVTAVILAGGEGRRMAGADKGLVELDGKPLIEHVIARLQPQVSNLIISANRNVAHYQKYGYPVITDQINHQGPLGGILSALQQCNNDWLLTLPCDTPYPPQDLCLRICQAASQTPNLLFTAHDGQRSQPLFSMIHCSLIRSLQTFLASNEKKVILWLKQAGAIDVEFSDQPMAFININTKEMLANIQKKHHDCQHKGLFKA